MNVAEESAASAFRVEVQLSVGPPASFLKVEITVRKETEEESHLLGYNAL
jgi:hypothetical protein